MEMKVCLYVKVVCSGFGLSTIIMVMIIIIIMTIYRFTSSEMTKSFNNLPLTAKYEQ